MKNIDFMLMKPVTVYHMEELNFKKGDGTIMSDANGALYFGVISDIDDCKITIDACKGKKTDKTYVPYEDDSYNDKEGDVLFYRSSDGFAYRPVHIIKDVKNIVNIDAVKSIANRHNKSLFVIEYDNHQLCGYNINVIDGFINLKTSAGFSTSVPVDKITALYYTGYEIGMSEISK